MTTIGTPYSDNATRVMLLGSGELGKEVAIELIRLGCEVIAVDRYPRAPAMQVAQRWHVIDMLDADAVRAVVEEERPALIVPEIEAIATAELEALEQEGFTVIPTARAARLTMNREGIRRLAAEELGLKTSPYAFASTAAELKEAIEAGIGFPCFVKPVMSSSGKGQSLLKGPDDIQPAWDYAMAGGRVEAPRVIVEGLVDFDYEITQLTVRAKGASGEVETHFCEAVGHRQVKGDYVESWQPQQMSEKALLASRDIAGKVTAALGGRGIFGVELFVKGDEVWFSEVSPRPHDTGLVTLITQYQSEFALHARAILGLPVTVDMISSGASAVIYGGLEEKGIAFEGVDKALSLPGTDIRLFGKPESFERRRMGVALARAADAEEARKIAKQAADAVKPVSGPVSGTK